MATAGTRTGIDRATLHRLLRLRAPLVLLALLLLVGSIWLSRTQAPWPYPFEPLRTLSLDWWRYPAETNAFRRLPAVGADLNDVFFHADGARGWAVGDDGTILATSDGGQSWAPQTSGTNAGLEAIHVAADGARGWAVGRGGTILATSDGGQTWAPQTSGTDAWLTAIHVAADGARGWAVGEEGTILATSDGGKSWAPQTSGTDAWLNEIHVAADGARGWAVGTGDTILATSDGGQSWAPQTSGTNAVLQAIHVAADGVRGWAVGFGGTILATSDGGRSWVALASDYRRGPAPWVYLAWFGAFVCLVGAARPLPPPSEAESESVADRLASDRPLAPGDPDPLGYGRIAAGVSRFLRNDKTEPPLTVAITGEWGTGKSSLMNLLCADLGRHGFRPVWFNAWHHQKEQHLFAALLEAVRAQAVPSWWSLAGLTFRWRLVRKRTRAHLFWTVVIVLVSGISIGAAWDNWPQMSVAVSGAIDRFLSEEPAAEATKDQVLLGLSPVEGAPAEDDDVDPMVAAWLDRLWHALKTLSPLLAWVPPVYGAWMTLRNRLSSWQLSPAKMMASMGARMQVKALDAQLGFRHQFAEAFSEVCAALRPRTLVIVIDDLDRCRPEQVVESLEAVNFLVTAGRCYVILGIAPEQVMRSVGLGFKDIAHEMADEVDAVAEQGRASRLEFARNYLEKLINVEVPVPVLSEQGARELVESATEAGPTRPWTRGLGTWALRVSFLTLLIGSLAAGTVLDDWLAPEEASAPPPMVAVVEPTIPAPAAGPTEEVQPRDGEENVPEEAPPAPRATFTPGDPAEPPAWSWQVPAVAVVLLVLIALLIHWFWRHDPRVRDSENFEKALGIWAPVVLAGTRSPRALKRFVNRVRYYAMTESPPPPTPSFWDRITRRDPAGELPEVQPEKLPEELLVALGAIQQWRPESPWAANGDGRYELRVPKGAAPDSDEAIVTQALANHQKTFRDKLTPTDREIEDFRKIAAGVTVR